jgi:hypothetical protein
MYGFSRPAQLIGSFSRAWATGGQREFVHSTRKADRFAVAEELVDAGHGEECDVSGSMR